LDPRPFLAGVAHTKVRQFAAEQAARLRGGLTRAARDVDAGFPVNSQLSIVPGGVPHLKRQQPSALPKGLDVFEAMVRTRMNLPR
jgi:hypothetical protein